jgi:hypothetical protein
MGSATERDDPMSRQSPIRRHRFTTEVYFRMAEVGILADDVAHLNPTWPSFATTRPFSCRPLVEDRRRAEGSAVRCARVRECWVVDLVHERILVHTGPGRQGYSNVHSLARGEVVSTGALPGERWAVDDILGGPPAS